MPDFPISIDGLDGSESPENLAILGAAMERALDEKATDPDGAEQRVTRLVQLNHALDRYNRLRAAIYAEEHARSERDRALHLVEVRWEALSTAAAWLAAHHAYVLAVDDARICLDIWEDRARTVSRMAGFNLDQGAGEREIAAYQQEILAAGYPPADPPRIDPAAEADQLRANLNMAHTRREELAASTASLLGA